jgi:hypothetical protein
MGYAGPRRLDDRRRKTGSVGITKAGLTESHPRAVAITREASNCSRVRITALHTEAALKKLSEHLRKLGVLAANPVDSALQRTCLGRVISALTFIAIVLCLVLWITGFLLFRDSGIQKSVSAAIYTNLSCIIFFGGLVIAIGIGAMLGNLVRRTLWKALLKRRN